MTTGTLLSTRPTTTTLQCLPCECQTWDTRPHNNDSTSCHSNNSSYYHSSGGGPPWCHVHRQVNVYLKTSTKLTGLQIVALQDKLRMSAHGSYRPRPALFRRQPTCGQAARQLSHNFSHLSAPLLPLNETALRPAWSFLLTTVTFSTIINNHSNSSIIH